MTIADAVSVIKTGERIWRAAKPITRIKRKLNKRRARKGKPLLEINEQQEEEAMIGALKSKTVWFGIATSAWGLVQIFIQAGDFSREALVSLVSGIVIIVLRAVTTKPLDEK